MWIFCKHGYFSAVAHNAKPDTILLRARFKGDLERLRDRFPDFVGSETAVKATPDADYAYRMELPKSAWAEIVAAVANDIDYPNFKSRVHDGTVRDDAYMGCWAALRRAQEIQK